MEEITEHDVTLMSALILEGMSAEVVAEKFETIESEVIQKVYPTNYYVKPSLYLRRKASGKVRLGEDCLEKRCSRCKQFLPIGLDFFHHDKNSQDGLLGWCRACECDRAKAKRVAAGQKVKKG
ncbi:hypothetical protein [Vibrio europaeus]|uniref:hypothetical protein n=1 Tax=Vibrio europaeus TaxID=300876 RepID=UPI00233EBF90|nr:hypothetical protein [Vibrio europaeus]MDC5753540.1 hypothetical protein [Vibrio europaeus]MDC5816547.1 hypothetical protein [Vibrio europaeus]